MELLQSWADLGCKEQVVRERMDPDLIFFPSFSKFPCVNVFLIASEPLGLFPETLNKGCIFIAFSSFYLFLWGVIPCCSSHFHPGRENP